MKLILLFAKQPLLEAVFPGMHPAYAALLYQAYLRDQILASGEVKDATLRICFGEGLLPGCLEGEMQWQRQEGADDAARLDYALASAFQGGYKRVLVLGLKPRLAPSEALWIAFDALETHSVVGGRALRGFSRHLPALSACDSGHLPLFCAAYSLKFQSVNLGLDYADLPSLKQALSKDPQQAPLSAQLLASML
jgi:hypothetical protein